MEDKMGHLQRDLWKLDDLMRIIGSGLRTLGVATERAQLEGECFGFSGFEQDLPVSCMALCPSGFSLFFLGGLLLKGLI